MAFKMLYLLFFFTTFISIDNPIDGKYLLVELDDVEGKLFISNSYCSNIVINKIIMIKNYQYLNIFLIVIH